MRFFQLCSFSGSRVMWRFVEKCWNRQSWTFGDLWWLNLWPDLKNDKKQFLHAFRRSFECRLPHFATWPRSRVTRGVFKHTPPPARRVRRRAAAQRGLRFQGHYALRRIGIQGVLQWGLNKFVQYNVQKGDKVPLKVQFRSFITKSHKNAPLK